MCFDVHIHCLWFVTEYIHLELWNVLIMLLTHMEFHHAQIQVLYNLPLSQSRPPQLVSHRHSQGL